MIKFNNSCDGVYDSVDVRFTKKCDNNCEFCIEKNGAPIKEEASILKMGNAILQYGAKNVLILGGEPLLDVERLSDLTSFIYGFVDNIYVTTSLPYTIVKEKAYFKRMMYDLTFLNVTLNSVDYVENNKSLRASSDHNRIALLRSILNSHADKVRVNLNLVKGYIDTKEKLLHSLHYLQIIGCKHIKINELQKSSKYVSYEDIMGIKMSPPYSTGCQQSVEIEGVNIDDIVVKRSCFLVEQSRKASFTDFVKVLISKFRRQKNRFAVLYEDGSVERGWIVDMDNKVHSRE